MEITLRFDKLTKSYAKFTPVEGQGVTGSLYLPLEPEYRQASEIRITVEVPASV